MLCSGLELDCVWGHGSVLLVPPTRTLSFGAGLLGLPVAFSTAHWQRPDIRLTWWDGTSGAKV